MTEPRLYIVGSGGVGQMALQIAHDMKQQNVTNWNLDGVFDDDEERHGEKILGVEIRGSVNELTDVRRGNIVVAIANPKIKLEIAEFIENGTKHTPITLRHPDSWIGENVDIGEGSILYPGVKIDPNVHVGKHVQLNKNVTIGHDADIGRGTTFAPGVNLGGHTDIKRGVYFGINSATIQELTVEEYVKVGAGATVVGDIPKNTIVVGTPAEPIK